MQSHPAGRNGIFVISLDFELMWGVRDNRSISEYGDCILGARAAIPRILNLFRSFNIRATWAVVGFLMFDNRAKLMASLPPIRPQVSRGHNSVYTYLQNIGQDEKSDPYHFARSLVEKIRHEPGQEIGTHTHSHFCALEHEDGIDAFQSDIETTVETAKNLGINLKSIAFPRNQWTGEHIKVCSRFGINTYRGTPHALIYRPVKKRDLTRMVRAARYIDAIVKTPIETSAPLKRVRDTAHNIVASRFFRPVEKGMRLHDNLRLRRIKSEIAAAARGQKLYHLWWHPHNFGRNTEQNLNDLKSVLMAFAKAAADDGMVSMNMADVSAAGLSA